MLNEEDSVQVINLMTESAGQQTFAAGIDFLAVNVLSSDGGTRRARSVGAKVRQRETSFLLLLPPLGGHDNGIHQHELFGLVLSSGLINHAKPFGDSDLRR